MALDKRGIWDSGTLKELLQVSGLLAPFQQDKLPLPPPPRSLD